MERLAPLLCAAFAAALYVPSLFNGLTNWDDGEYVLTNPVALKGWAGIPAAFTTFVDGAWYPLTHGLYALVHAIAGPSPLAHHLVQWVVFVAAAALIPFALDAFRVPRRIALLAALVWIAHPFRPESASWVANLKDTLSLLGVLAAFALYGHGRRWSALLAFTAALLGKSAVFPLALLFPLVDLIRGEALRRAGRWVIPFSLVGVGSAAMTSYALMHEPAFPTMQRPGGGSLWHALPTIVWKPVWYLGRTLWPSGPRAIYSDEVIGWSDPRFLFAAVVLIAAAVLIATRARSVRLFWCAGVFAWLLPFAPVVGVMPLRFHAADRYTLIPSLALAVGVALGLAALALRIGRPALGTATVFSVAVVLVPFNVLRQREWHDGISLFEANRALEPSVWEVRFNLAGAYGGEARWSEAISELEATWRLEPSRRRVLGDLFFAQAAKAGKDGAWIDRYAGPIERSGFRSEAFLAQAGEVIGDGDAPELARVLVDLGTRDGDHAEAHAVLARIERAEHHPEASLEQARKALQMAPSNELPKVDVVVALADLGRFDEALQAAVDEPRDTQVRSFMHGARAYVLSKMGRNSEAAALLEQARQELKAAQAQKAKRSASFTH